MLMKPYDHSFAMLQKDDCLFLLAGTTLQCMRKQISDKPTRIRSYAMPKPHWQWLHIHFADSMDSTSDMTAA